MCFSTTSLKLKQCCIHFLNMSYQVPFKNVKVIYIDTDPNKEGVTFNRENLLLMKWCLMCILSEQGICDGMWFGFCDGSHRSSP